MKFKISVKNAGYPDSSAWWEEIDENIKDAKAYAKTLIDDFNNTLRPNEQPRELLEVVVLDAESRKQHSWSKTNLITIQPRRGASYDTYECQICGVTGRRYGLAESVTIDKKYSANVYQRCDTAEDHLKKRRKPSKAEASRVDLQQTIIPRPPVEITKMATATATKPPEKPKNKAPKGRVPKNKIPAPEQVKIHDPETGESLVDEWRDSDLDDLYAKYRKSKNKLAMIKETLKRQTSELKDMLEAKREQIKEHTGTIAYVAKCPVSGDWYYISAEDQVTRLAEKPCPKDKAPGQEPAKAG